MEDFTIAFCTKIIGSIDFILLGLLIVFGALLKLKMYYDIDADTCKYDYSLLSDFYTFLFALFLAFNAIYIMKYEIEYLFVFWNTIMMLISIKVLIGGFWASLKGLYKMYQVLK